MSIENLNSFRLALVNDQSLQAGLRAASGVGDGNAVPVEAFLSFAVAKGYDISAADLESMQEELSDEAWDATINIGLKGSFLMSQTVGKHMIAQKSGCIINVASIAGLSPYNFAGSYSSVKAGIIMFTKQIALEWGQYGIRCNAIAPGFIHTPGTEGMYSNAEIKKGREAFTPLGRIGTGDDVARIAVFLASEEASYTTGSVIETDGGQNVGLYMAVPGRSFSGGALK